jgi:hypothetical protein
MPGWQEVDRLLAQLSRLAHRSETRQPLSRALSSRLIPLHGLHRLDTTASEPVRAYVGHAQQKLWIADYSADRIERVTHADLPQHEHVPWGRTILVNAYLFTGVLELASALDNLAYVLNTIRGLGVASDRVDFPLLLRSPRAATPNIALSTWQNSPEGQFVMAFGHDPWIAYLYQLRNQLTHHTVGRLYTVALGDEGFGFVLPAPGAVDKAGGGPDAADALAVFIELVATFADELATRLSGG